MLSSREREIEFTEKPGIQTMAEELHTAAAFCSAEVQLRERERERNSAKASTQCCYRQFVCCSSAQGPTA